MTPGFGVATAEADDAEDAEAADAADNAAGLAELLFADDDVVGDDVREVAGAPTTQPAASTKTAPKSRLSIRRRWRGRWDTEAGMRTL